MLHIFEDEEMITQAEKYRGVLNIFMEQLESAVYKETPFPFTAPSSKCNQSLLVSVDKESKDSELIIETPQAICEPSKSAYLRQILVFFRKKYFDRTNNITNDSDDDETDESDSITGFVLIYSDETEFEIGNLKGCILHSDLPQDKYSDDNEDEKVGIKYCTYFSSTKPLRRGEYIVEIEQDQDYCGVATKINFKTSKRRSLGYFQRNKYSCTYNEDSYDSDNDEWDGDYYSDCKDDYLYQNCNSNGRSKPLRAKDGRIIRSFTWSNVGRKITSIITQKTPRKLAPKDKEISLFNFFPGCIFFRNDEILVENYESYVWARVETRRCLQCGALHISKENCRISSL